MKILMQTNERFDPILLSNYGKNSFDWRVAYRQCDQIIDNNLTLKLQPLLVERHHKKAKAWSNDISRYLTRADLSRRPFQIS